MSKFLIAFGSLVIVILLTALIGPFFVDWTSYRESFEREASAYIGRPVDIAGKASVRLLPTPVVSFTNIRIGEIDDPEMDIERFRAEVELAPLLKGEVRIVQMAVERPRFHLDIAGLGEGRGLFGGVWRVDPERISLARLEVREGSADVADSRTGRAWRMEGINGVVEADSLRGPGRVEGTLTLDGRLFSVRAALGRLAGDALPTNVSISSPQVPVTLAADGTLRFPGSEAPSFEGAAVVEGAAAAEDGSPWRDFRASGPVVLSLAGVAADGMQISYGGAERPLIVETSGHLDFGREPRFDLAVAARQIDIDRTLGFGGEAPAAIGQAVAALMEKLPLLEVPPIPGTLRLDAQGVLAGGSLVSQVVVDLATAGDAWLVREMSGVLPGETRVGLHGEFKVGGDPRFVGKGAIESTRPATFATWWKGSVGSAARLGEFAVEADLDVARDRQMLSNLRIATPAGTTGGSVELRRFEEPQGLFLTVNLSADRADAVEMRALGELLSTPGMSLGDVRQMTLSLQAGTLAADNVEANAVLIEGGYEAGRLDLRRLSVADLQGASVNATGHIDDPLGARSGRIDASIDAEDIAGAATFLSRLLPGNPLAARLVAAAPILSPLRAEFSAETGAEAGNLIADLTGSFADTHVSLHAEGKGDLSSPADFEGTARLHVDGEDTATVLAQLGFAPLSVRSGLLSLDADFRGNLSSGGALKVAGTVAGIDVGYSGEAAIDAGRLALSGEIEASAEDIDPALLLAGVAIPGIGEGHAASVAGTLELEKDRAELALREASFDDEPVSGSVSAEWTGPLAISGSLGLQSASVPFIAALAAGPGPVGENGTWSDRPFASPLPQALRLDLALDVAQLDLGASVAALDARTVVRLDGGALSLDIGEADFAGGKLKGTLTAKLEEGEVEASLSAALTAAQLQALVGERAGLPVASGALDLSVEVSGTGRSMAGIIATLAGSGSFTVNDGRLNALDPMALREVMQAAEGENEPDETAARETFASRFDSGAFSFGHAAGSFQLGSGVVEVSKVSLEGEAATVLADARLDLGRMTVESHWTVRVEPEGEAATQPYVTLTYSGRAAAPERRVDLNPLLDQLRSRFLQRQLDEIERLEEERRRADAAAAALAAAEAARAAEEAASVPTGSVSAEPVAVPGSTIPSAISPAMGVAPPEQPPAGASDMPVGASASGTLRDSDLLLDIPPAGSGLGAASPEFDVLEAYGPPLSLMPEPAPPEPPAAEPRRRAARPVPSPAPQLVAPPPAAAPAKEYRTLPNGVVVKIR